MTIYTSERFAHHLTPPGHPERPERAEVLSRVADRWGRLGARLVEPAAADEPALTRIHTPAYVAAIRATAGRAVWLDADTSTSPESYEVACLAAGAAIGTVDQVLAAPDAGPAFAFVRPPGHHAEAERAMGFCLFNSIAVAAAHARAAGIARVAIVDVDVHHGNGTQAAFYADPSVLFISSHQFPYYPGTGAATEIGQGRRRRIHREPAARGRRRRRRCGRGVSAGGPARSRPVRAPARARLGRVRRPRGRPARWAANDRSRVRRPGPAAGRRRLAPRRRPAGAGHRGRLRPRRPRRLAARGARGRAPTARIATPRPWPAIDRAAAAPPTPPAPP